MSVSPCLQIGHEKHRMLNLFMQVPGLVRKRLAKRCKEVYEQTVMLHALAEEGEDDELPQVRLAHPPTSHPREQTRTYIVHQR